MHSPRPIRAPRPLHAACLFVLIVAAALFGQSAPSVPPGPPPVVSEAGVTARFDSSAAMAAAIERIGAATTRLLVQCPRLPAGELAQALRDASRRGRSVTILLDHHPARSEAIVYVADNVKLFVDPAAPEALGATVLVDDHTIIAGPIRLERGDAVDPIGPVLFFDDAPNLFAAWFGDFNRRLAAAVVYDPSAPSPDTDASADAPSEVSPSSAEPDATEDDQGSAAADSTIVYGTRSGRKYHRANCSHLRKSKVEMSLEEAKRKGLEPCQTCRPED